MSATEQNVRHMLERQLIEGDDRQTQRGWCLEAEGQFLIIRPMRDGGYFMTLRLADIKTLIGDLETIGQLAGRPAP